MRMATVTEALWLSLSPLASVRASGQSQSELLPHCARCGSCYDNVLDCVFSASNLPQICCCGICVLPGAAMTAAPKPREEGTPETTGIGPVAAERGEDKKRG